MITKICDYYTIIVYKYQKPFVDFSTSRNYMLDIAYETHVDVDYLLLIDAGDILVGEGLKSFLSEEKGDIFSVKLDWKENNKIVQHKSSRLVVNSNTYRYKYRVHEILECKDTRKNNRGVCVPEKYFSLFQDRTNETNDRYIEDIKILKEDLKEDPNDSRMIFYLAQSYFFNEDYSSAIKWYKKRSNIGPHPNEESLQSMINIGRSIVYSKGGWDKALSWFWCSYHYYQTITPIVYITEHLISLNNYKEAYHVLRLAYSISPDNTLFLNTNKLEYDFNRHYLMSIASSKLGKWEKCYKAITKCQNFLSDNTGIYDENIVNNVTTIQNNLVTNYLSGYNHRHHAKKKTILIFSGWEYKKWNGLSLQNGGLGGSETSAVLLAETLVEYGFHVVICCDTNDRVLVKGVEYITIEDYEPFLSSYIVDVLIIERYTRAIRDYINIGKIILWFQDMDPMNMFQMNNLIQHIVPLTDFHANYLREKIIPNHLHDMLTPIGNAIIPERFQKDIEIVPLRFIYSSCPTRGLQTLLPVFKKIKEIYSEAELYIYSDFNTNYAKKKVNTTSLLNQIDEIEGVYNMGRVSQDILSEEMLKADYWLYPTAFEETYCITALEAQAARCICLYTNIGSLPEVIGKRGLIVNTESEVLSVIEKLEENKEKKELLRNEAREWAMNQSYEKRAKEWIKLIL